MLPPNVQWKGWVPLENLVLWDHALCQDNGHPMKYLISSNSQKSNASDNVGKLFTHPTEPRSFIRLPSSPKSIFYLLKQEGKMALLAQELTINDNPEVIYGWVDVNSVYYWPSRVSFCGVRRFQ